MIFQIELLIKFKIVARRQQAPAEGVIARCKPIEVCLERVIADAIEKQNARIEDIQIGFAEVIAARRDKTAEQRGRKYVRVLAQKRRIAPANAEKSLGVNIERQIVSAKIAADLHLVIVRKIPIELGVQIVKIVRGHLRLFVADQRQDRVDIRAPARHHPRSLVDRAFERQPR